MWRRANPSAYGNIIFQATCNDRIYQSYEDSAAAYTATKQAAQVIGWILMLLSAGCLGLRVIRRMHGR
jgi:hypothetical protein